MHSTQYHHMCRKCIFRLILLSLLFFYDFYMNNNGVWHACIDRNINSYFILITVCLPFIFFLPFVGSQIDISFLYSIVEILTKYVIRTIWSIIKIITCLFVENLYRKETMKCRASRYI